MSGILFARFTTVEPINERAAFNRAVRSLLFFSLRVFYDVTKKVLSMVGTWSNVEKQAKRMPDTTVETTKIKKPQGQIFYHKAKP